MGISGLCGSLGHEWQKFKYMATYGMVCEICGLIYRFDDLKGDWNILSLEDGGKVIAKNIAPYDLPSSIRNALRKARMPEV